MPQARVVVPGLLFRSSAHRSMINVVATRALVTYTLQAYVQPPDNRTDLKGILACFSGEATIRITCSAVYCR